MQLPKQQTNKNQRIRATCRIRNTILLLSRKHDYDHVSKLDARTNASVVYVTDVVAANTPMRL